MQFREILQKHDWQSLTAEIYSKTETEVRAALDKKQRNLEDFKALLSPAAAPFLEEMAQISRRLTQKRFGKTILLYIPLYLSNFCQNSCVYCGFSSRNKIKRVVLSQEQVLREVEVIKSYGYEHILLVTGEHPQKAGTEYLKEIVELIKPHFSLISIEVQPLEEEDYRQLIDLGLNTVYLYQETYNAKTYPEYHPTGKKADFDYRLDTYERLGRAGVHRMGLGCLLGLEDWRTDSFFTALHLKYLEKTYWQSKYSVSFPRLRPHEGDFQPGFAVNDRELVQLICAYRLLDEEVELSVSTRESKKFRDNVVALGTTSMSAGSKTEPGGYALGVGALEQFSVHDNRTPAQIEEMIEAQGYEAVWKDWDSFMQL